MSRKIYVILDGYDALFALENREDAQAVLNDFEEQDIALDMSISACTVYKTKVDLVSDALGKSSTVLSDSFIDKTIASEPLADRKLALRLIHSLTPNQRFIVKQLLTTETKE